MSTVTAPGVTLALAFGPIIPEYICHRGTARCDNCRREFRRWVDSNNKQQREHIAFSPATVAVINYALSIGWRLW